MRRLVLSVLYLCLCVASSLASDSVVVKKDAVSSKVRFVFFAGLEGSGHHGVNSAYKECGVMCASAKAVAQELLAGGDQPHGAFVYGRQTDEQIRSHRAAAIDAFRRVEAEHGSGPARLVFVNCGAGLPAQNKSGEMSYPNYAGPNKVLHNPDVTVLARLAEDAGVDLRVVVLRRGAEDILRSTTMHRHFGSEAHEAAVLAESAAYLAAQLRMLDPAFVECVTIDALFRDGVRALDALLWGGAEFPRGAKVGGESRRLLLKSEVERRNDIDPDSVFVEHLGAYIAGIDDACESAARRA